MGILKEFENESYTDKECIRDNRHNASIDYKDAYNKMIVINKEMRIEVEEYKRAIINLALRLH